ncbi:MAG: MFS transporter [Arcobacter sp.]|uniref:MFS transporter n=1 Tax=uncultured Arcobacter sp. TaxID=165434 RepID=UPI000CC1B8DB|nr:MFS transporter [uncultured Arcobacter sp.]PLY11462.1 MAG: MFS transporter [Arcobacter sp.]
MNKNIAKIAYGTLAIPIAFLGLPIYIYLPNFYVNEIGLNVALVGIALFLSRLLDMISDPFIGLISDKYIKKSYLIVLGSITLLFSFYFLIHPSSSNSFLWLFIFSALTYISWSFINIPYLALNAELGKNYQDNTNLSFSREVFTIIGVVIALLLPYIYNISQNPKESLNLLLKTSLIVFPIVIFIFVFFIKENKSSMETLPFFDSLKRFKKDFAKANNIFIAFILNNLANAIPATLFLFYVQLVLKTPEYTGALLLVYFISAVIALPFWIYLSKKIDKQKVWISSIALAVVSFSFVPFLGEEDYILFGLISFCTGVSLSADMAIPASIQSDIAQKSKTLGNQISGVLFGFWNMLTKLSLALAVFITFIILEIVGFDVNNLSNLALNTLIILYSILPILLKLVAVFFINRYQF